VYVEVRAAITVEVSLDHPPVCWFHVVTVLMDQHFADIETNPICLDLFRESIYAVAELIKSNPSDEDQGFGAKVNNSLQPGV